MFKNFTDRAKRVMALANQEAQRLNHEYIGTEHVLLGVLKESSGVGRILLKQLGIDLIAARVAVEQIVRPGPEMVTMGRLPQTPRLKHAIRLSEEFVKKLDDTHVGTEHLVYGLLAETDSISSQVLQNFKITKERYVKVLRETLDKPDEEAIIKSCQNCLSFDVCVLMDCLQDIIIVSKSLGFEDMGEYEEKTYQLLIGSCPHYKEEEK